MSQDFADFDKANVTANKEESRVPKVMDDIGLVMEIGILLNYLPSREDIYSLQGLVRFVANAPADPSETPKLNKAFLAAKDNQDTKRGTPPSVRNGIPEDHRESSAWLNDRIGALSCSLLVDSPEQVVTESTPRLRSQNHQEAIFQLQEIVDILLEKMPAAKAAAYKPGSDLGARKKMQQLERLEELLKRYAATDLEGAANNTLDTAAVRADPELASQVPGNIMHSYRNQISQQHKEAWAIASNIQRQILDVSNMRNGANNDPKPLDLSCSGINKSSATPRREHTVSAAGRNFRRKGTSGQWTALGGPGGANQEVEEGVRVTAADLSAALKSLDAADPAALMMVGRNETFDALAATLLATIERQKFGPGEGTVIDM